MFSILLDISKSPKIVNLLINSNESNNCDSMSRVNGTCDINSQSALMRMVSRFVRLMDKHDG